MIFKREKLSIYYKPASTTKSDSEATKGASGNTVKDNAGGMLYRSYLDARGDLHEADYHKLARSSRSTASKPPTETSNSEFKNWSRN